MNADKLVKIKSMVVCIEDDVKTKEFYANLETSEIYNLTTDNLRVFVAEAMKPFVETVDLIKISTTLEYRIGESNHLYQVIITNNGIEEFTSNPNVETMPKINLDNFEI